MVCPVVRLSRLQQIPLFSRFLASFDKYERWRMLKQYTDANQFSYFNLCRLWKITLKFSQSNINQSEYTICILTGRWHLLKMTGEIFVICIEIVRVYNKGYSICIFCTTLNLVARFIAMQNHCFKYQTLTFKYANRWCSARVMRHCTVEFRDRRLRRLWKKAAKEEGWIDPIAPSHHSINDSHAHVLQYRSLCRPHVRTDWRFGISARDTRKANLDESLRCAIAFFLIPDHARCSMWRCYVSMFFLKIPWLLVVVSQEASVVFIKTCDNYFDLVKIYFIFR